MEKVFSKFSDTENECVKTFKENLIFNSSRYEVKLPFRPHIDFIPNNYIVTEKCLTPLPEQSIKDSILLFEYDKFVNDYLSMGIIEKVPLNENTESGTIHYLSHRAVVKSEREITKVRVVFESSSKQSDKPSLNDLLYARPCFLRKLNENSFTFSIWKDCLYCRYQISISRNRS